VTADFALSHARFTGPDPDGAGHHIPGAVEKVASFGVTVADYGPWFGHFQVRHFGPRPLTKDDAQRSKATTLAYLRVGYKVTPSVRVALDVFNVFDTERATSTTSTSHAWLGRRRGKTFTSTRSSREAFA
jgi:hypothetical protein